MPARLKKNDNVMVISGEYKGRTGRIIKLFPEKKKAIVEGVNTVKRHTKPSQQDQQGGIKEKDAPVAMSNLMLLCPKTGKPTRVGTQVLEDGKRVRYSKKAKELID